LLRDRRRGPKGGGPGAARARAGGAGARALTRAGRGTERAPPGREHGIAREAAVAEGARALDRSIDAYLDHLATERGLARRSVDAYARDLAAFVRGLVSRRVRTPAAIGAGDVRAHLAALAARGLSPRSQARAPPP